MMTMLLTALVIAVAVGAGVWALGQFAENWLNAVLGPAGDSGAPDAELSDFDRAMARAMRDDDEALY